MALQWGFHNIPVSLRWTKNDACDFVLGAFLIHTKELAMVPKTTPIVENFSANRTTYVTFTDDSSLPGNQDCILLAWLPDDHASHHFAQSKVFSVIDPEATKSDPISSISCTLSGSGTALRGMGPASPGSTTSKSTIPHSPTSGATPPMQSTTKFIPIEAIVDIVIGSFALLLSVVLALDPAAEP
ncbi:hypothetical protein IW262DRAFT_1455256 [Armillaria fumosa]|nr:hypothetical protein IW262DRAFT_1455256 [Armillaria fumosa]